MILKYTYKELYKWLWDGKECLYAREKLFCISLAVVNVSLLSKN